MAHEFDPEGPSPVPPLTGGAIDYDPKPVPPPPPRPVALPTTPVQSSSGPAIVMSLILTALGIGAFFAGKSMEESAPPATPPPATAEAKPEPAADAAKPAEPSPTPPAETAVAAADAPMKDDLAALSKRIDDLKAAVEADPKNDAESLKPLQAKVDELAKLPEMVAPMTKRLDDLDGRLNEMGTSFDAMKTEVAALKTSPAPSPAPAAAAAAEEPRTEDVNTADAAMGQAVDLFKQGKYKEANDAFVKLSQDDANDARVWYYAALSNGLATRAWKGDTETYVKKGVEREKAGSPTADKIDPVFAELTKTTGKDWLAGWRKLAK